LETKDYQDHVHHISLPWGIVQKGKWGHTTQYSVPLPMVPVFYPKVCQVKAAVGTAPPSLQPPPKKFCNEIMGEQVMTRPHRFFVNMTTNIQWYRERGVRVYPIMVVRDPMMHFQGIVKRSGGHCPNATAAYQQFEQGRAIMVETVEKGLKPIIISYETMLTLQKPYLQDLYDQLGIQTTFFPSFRNGNTKYLSPNGKPHPYVELELMKEDAPPPKKYLPANNFRPPPSPQGQRPVGKTNRVVAPLTRAEIKKGAMLKPQLKNIKKTSIQHEERYREMMKRLHEIRARREKEGGAFQPWEI
jgi:hypothetical protein